MSEASEIIKQLDLSDGDIAKMIGFSRLAVLQVQNKLDMQHTLASA